MAVTFLTLDEVLAIHAEQIDPNELAELVLGVAEGTVGKAEVAMALAGHSSDVSG